MPGPFFRLLEISLVNSALSTELLEEVLGASLEGLEVPSSADLTSFLTFLDMSANMSPTLYNFDALSSNSLAKEFVLTGVVVDGFDETSLAFRIIASSSVTNWCQ